MALPSDAGSGVECTLHLARHARVLPGIVGQLSGRPPSLLAAEESLFARGADSVKLVLAIGVPHSYAHTRAEADDRPTRRRISCGDKEATMSIIG